MHVVVVGSGIAGLTAAIRASTAHDVTLVTKGALADGATAYAQGGIAVALGADDTSALHQADTHVAAAGSADARAVEVLCTDGPARVRDLLALGVPFDRSSDPATLDRYGDDLARGREAAHGRWRVLHADGDATGAAVERTLIDALHRRHVTILERTSLTDLVVRGGAVVGVDVLDLLGDPRRIDADTVVIASGERGTCTARRRIRSSRRATASPRPGGRAPSSPTSSSCSSTRRDSPCPVAGWCPRPSAARVPCSATPPATAS